MHSNDMQGLKLKAMQATPNERWPMINCVAHVIWFPSDLFITCYCSSWCIFTFLFSSILYQRLRGISNC